MLGPSDASSFLWVYAQHIGGHRLQRLLKRDSMFIVSKILSNRIICEHVGGFASLHAPLVPAGAANMYNIMCLSRCSWDAKNETFLWLLVAHVQIRTTWRVSRAPRNGVAQSGFVCALAKLMASFFFSVCALLVRGFYPLTRLIGFIECGWPARQAAENRVFDLRKDTEEWMRL